MKRNILIILTILWMIIIFLFSGSNGDKSSNTSGIIVNKIVPIVEKIINKKLTEEQVSNYISYPIRKCAHITEYLILGILVYLSINTYQMDKNKIIILSILICILYSVSDEFHQLFISGRSGKITDCIYDTFGSTLGICITALINKKDIIKRVRKI